jgi:hypothetical protein
MKASEGSVSPKDFFDLNFRQISVATPARTRHFPRDNSPSFPYN